MVGEVHLLERPQLMHRGSRRCLWCLLRGESSSSGRVLAIEL